MKLQLLLTHSLLIGVVMISTGSCALNSASNKSSSQASFPNSQRTQQKHNFASIPFEQQSQQMIALIWDKKFPQEISS